MACMKLSAAKREKAKKTFNRVEMRIIPRGCMREAYKDGWGDYWVDERDTLQIRAVEMPDLMFSHYILLHEYLEAIRCYRDGISLESIEKWDADHADHPDPGSIPGAPYHKHHMASLMVEQIVCMQDGHEWEEYDNAMPIESK